MQMFFSEWNVDADFFLFLYICISNWNMRRHGSGKTFISRRTSKCSVKYRKLRIVAARRLRGDLPPSRFIARARESWRRQRHRLRFLVVLLVEFLWKSHRRCSLPVVSRPSPVTHMPVAQEKVLCTHRGVTSAYAIMERF